MKKLLIFILLFFVLILWVDFFMSSWFYYNLDTVFYPIDNLSNFFSRTVFFHFWDIWMLVNYKIFSKLFLILCLCLWAFLWYKLANYLINNFIIINNKNIILLLQISSIIFTISNPFIYERLVTQTWVVFWIFFIWIWFIYLLEFFEKKDDKKFYLSSLFFWLALSALPHTIFFVVIIWIISLIFFLKHFSLKNIFVWILIFIWINLNWLIWDFFLNNIQNWVKNITNNLNTENVEVFKQNSIWGLWVELTSLTWYWFWWEKYWHVDIPNLSIFWYFSAICVFSIILIGAVNIFQKDKKIFYYFLTLYTIFFILALWFSSSIFYWFNNFLYSYIPFYIGMREPWKFLWVIAILNTIFFVIWIYWVVKYFKSKFEIEKSFFDLLSMVIIIFIITSLYTPWILFGFRGQIKIVNYPEEYFESKSFLAEKKEFKNVIFPWHTYIKCEWWNGRISWNTYQHILWFKESIYSDNIEIWNIYTNNNNPVSQKVEEFLKTKNLKLLGDLWIKNIIFQDKCADFEAYKFLESLNWLEKVFDKKYLKIYKIK